MLEGIYDKKEIPEAYEQNFKKEVIVIIMKSVMFFTF